MGSSPRESLSQLNLGPVQLQEFGQPTDVLIRFERQPGDEANQQAAVKAVQEVCTVFCATANEVAVVVARSSRGSGILGVIDGEPPAGGSKMPFTFSRSFSPVGTWTTTVE